MEVNRVRTSSQVLIAPGPATDHITSHISAYRSISKSFLISLAQSKNIQFGRYKNAGLEDFIPKKAAFERKSQMKSENKKKKAGFRSVPVSIVNSPGRQRLNRQFGMKTVLVGAIKSRWTRELPWGSRAMTSKSVGDLKGYREKVRKRVPMFVEKLTKRRILSREENEVRANSSATVLVYAKAKLNRICRVFATRETSDSQWGPSLRRLSFLKHEFLQDLETAVVDKVAVAEMRTRKKDEQQSAFPKMTSAQIQGKLTHLRTTAQQAFKPLTATSNLEVLRLNSTLPV